MPLRRPSVFHTQEGTGKYAFAALETVSLSAPFGWRSPLHDPMSGRAGFAGELPSDIRRPGDAGSWPGGSTTRW